MDDLYEEFAAGLGGDLAAHARDLPRALRLSPVRDTRWSAVFKHEITLAAPALFADALPGASLLAVREAVRAHMFSVIDAFGTDRVEDGQVLLTSDGLRVLEKVRAERDASIARLAGSAPADVDADPGAIDRATMDALRRERELLRSGEGVDFETYESVALAKQSAGVVATCVLARIAGASPARYRAIQQALESVALALQMHDDVVDWEDDQSRGGAWVVSIMRGGAPVTAAARSVPTSTSLRGQVLGCDVLLRMLRRGRWHMRAAAARSRVLGATRAAAWAAGARAIAGGARLGRGEQYRLRHPFPRALGVGGRGCSHEPPPGVRLRLRPARHAGRRRRRQRRRPDRRHVGRRGSRRSSRGS